MVDTTVQFTNLDTLNFAKGGGLLPVVVQHAGSSAVLMLGYMSRDALLATLTLGRVVFFSRSKERLWEKGETSGNGLEVKEIRTDCDRDTLLIRAWPLGPICHTGTESCFGVTPEVERDAVAFLKTLQGVVEERIRTRREGSYVSSLLDEGLRRIAQKVGEEGLETALAGAGGTDAEVVGEAADLIFHVLVLLKARGLSLERVSNELKSRHEASRR